MRIEYNNVYQVGGLTIQNDFVHELKLYQEIMANNMKEDLKKIVRNSSDLECDKFEKYPAELSTTK